MTRASEELKEDYLRWLEPQVRDEHQSNLRSIWELLNMMFEKKFEVVVPMDENRLVDGLDLRVEFGHATSRRSFRPDRLGPCSFLEVLVALSRTMAFVVGGEAPTWAWHLVCNLELQRMFDPLTPRKRAVIEKAMDTCIQRTYSPDGQGGFFPLAWAEDDQTKIELWYQLNAWAEELHPEH